MAGTLMGRSRAMPLLLRAIGALIVLGVVALLWGGDIQDALMAWKEGAGPVSFFLAMAVLPAIGVPITPFFVVAGATFGSLGGMLGSALAIAANLLLCFGLSRSALRPWLDRQLRRTPWDLPDLEGAPERALRFTVLMKLAPGVPVFVKHYAIALAGVPFRVYFGVLVPISLLYAGSFVVLGESLLSGDLGMGIAALAVLLVLAGGAAWWWRTRR